MKLCKILVTAAGILALVSIGACRNDRRNTDEAATNEPRAEETRTLPSGATADQSDSIGGTDDSRSGISAGNDREVQQRLDNVTGPIGDSTSVGRPSDTTGQGQETAGDNSGTRAAAGDAGASRDATAPR
jgi:hypothetical protein